MNGRDKRGLRRAALEELVRQAVALTVALSSPRVILPLARAP